MIAIATGIFIIIIIITAGAATVCGAITATGMMMLTWLRPFRILLFVEDMILAHPNEWTLRELL